VTGTVAIVFALGAQKEAVEPAELAHRIKTIEAPGKHFVDVTLMTNVHNESVVRRVKDAGAEQSSVQRHRDLGPDASGLGKGLRSVPPNLLRELGVGPVRAAL